MLYIALIFILIAVLLIIRLLTLKKEVKKLTNQLQSYNNRRTNKKMDMALIDQTIESLGVEINRLIDLYVSENRRRVRFEEEQRQAVANMSHDLRTPLTSIIGYIQMAESTDISREERKELLTVANSRAKRLETLLNDFFELSLIDSSDYQLKSERVNLRNVTADVLMGFYDRFQDKNMEPSIDLPDKDVYIDADVSAVTRVIENLLSNAIKHSDGNIIICLNEQDQMAKLIVKNDAGQLTKEDVQLMFDRYFMADKSRSGKSTGLGLSIVKSFMEKMDGNITGELYNGQLSITCTWKRVSN